MVAGFSSFIGVWGKILQVTACKPQPPLLFMDFKIQISKTCYDKQSNNK